MERGFSYVCVLVSILVIGTTRGQVNLGRFHSFAHGVKSGDVTVLDEKTIQIKDFYYDGKGPAGWFIVGKGQDYKKEKVEIKGYTVIPNEDKSCDVLKEYKGKTIRLVLPGKLTFKDLDYISAYCLEYHHNFGYVTIPNNLNVPSAPDTDLKECKTKWNSSGVTPGVSNLLLNFAVGLLVAVNLLTLGN